MTFCQTIDIQQYTAKKCRMSDNFAFFSKNLPTALLSTSTTAPISNWLEQSSNTHKELITRSFLPETMKRLLRFIGQAKKRSGNHQIIPL